MRHSYGFMGAFMTNKNFTREVLMDEKRVQHVCLMIYCYKISIDVVVRETKMYPISELHKVRFC